MPNQGWTTVTISKLTKTDLPDVEQIRQALTSSGALEGSSWREDKRRHIRDDAAIEGGRLSAAPSR
jgi:hypothetical protein